MKRTTQKTIIKLVAFLLLVNLPFLTMSCYLGLDTFLETFEHPSRYQYLKIDSRVLPNLPAGYLILEKPTHQGYSLKQGDIILYRSSRHLLDYRIVSSTELQQGMLTYYTESNDKENQQQLIHEHQILGKITGMLDDSLWSALSLQIWEMCKENLNTALLLSSYSS